MLNPIPSRIGGFLADLSEIIHAIFPCIEGAPDIFLGDFTIAWWLREEFFAQ